MPRIWVSVGSNMDRESNIRAAICAQSERFGKLLLSPVYETKAVGFDGAPFLNMVLGFHTDLALEHVRRELRDIENVQGRVRNGDKYGSRTLDLDILTYGKLVDEYQDIPRAEIMGYAFVLGPLADVAPNELHPKMNKTYAQLWQEFSDHKNGMQQVESSQLLVGSTPPIYGDDLPRDIV